MSENIIVSPIRGDPRESELTEFLELIASLSDYFGVVVWDEDKDLFGSIDGPGLVPVRYSATEWPGVQGSSPPMSVLLLHVKHVDALRRRMTSLYDWASGLRGLFFVNTSKRCFVLSVRQTSNEAFFFGKDDSRHDPDTVYEILDRFGYTGRAGDELDISHIDRCLEQIAESLQRRSE